MREKMSAVLKKSGIAAIAILTSATLLGGCGSEEATGFQTAFCATYVDEDAVETCGERIKTDLPELTIDGVEPSFVGMNMGDSESDPMGTMAGMTKFTAMVSGGELDVVISDLENAARNARGEAFLDVSSYLTDEELEEYEDKLLSFDMVDDEGNPTGEKTAVCGLDLSDNETISSLVGQDCGVFVVANTTHLDQAAELVRYLLKNS